MDKQDFPIIHDPAYAKRLQEARRKRTEVDLAASVEAATTRKRLDGCQSDHTSAKVDVAAAVRNYGDKFEHDLEQYSCDDVLDSLLSIYAVGTISSGCQNANLAPGATRNVCGECRCTGGREASGTRT